MQVRAQCGVFPHLDACTPSSIHSQTRTQATLRSSLGHAHSCFTLPTQKVLLGFRWGGWWAAAGCLGPNNGWPVASCWASSAAPPEGPGLLRSCPGWSGVPFWVFSQAAPSRLPLDLHSGMVVALGAFKLAHGWLAVRGCGRGRPVVA